MDYISYSHMRIDSYEEAWMVVAEWRACHPDASVYAPLIELVPGSTYRVEFGYS